MIASHVYDLLAKIWVRVDQCVLEWVEHCEEDVLGCMLLSELFLLLRSVFRG